MSEVKWIKIVTDIFDDEKMYAIETLQDGMTIEVVWFKLLCLAGKCNENGFLTINNKFPYTDEMLAKIFRLDLGIVKRALETFQSLEMIEVVDNTYMVSNWLKYQSGDKLEDLRAKQRERQRQYRERQKALKLITTTGERCVYCGDVADCVDHIVPKSKGGTDDANNLVPSCKSCNSSKKDKDLVDFLNDDLKYQKRLDHNTIQNNEKLMAHVRFDKEALCYSNVTVTEFRSISYSFKSSSSNIQNFIYITTHSNYKYKDYISSNKELLNILKEWMEYKDSKTPKKDNHYGTEMGMKKFLTITVEHDMDYGTEVLRKEFDKAIAQGWKGVIWDNVEKNPRIARQKINAPQTNNPQHTETEKEWDAFFGDE